MARPPHSHSQGRLPGPIHATPRRPGWHGCEDRIAWLLRANRLYGTDEKLANATVFAAAFRGGCQPEPVSVSQVSRWETATNRAGYAVLRRYEELLGLPPCRLTVVADWTYREAVGRAGPPVLNRRLDTAQPRVWERTEELLEQALSRGVMTGPWWDELTAHLLAQPAVLLYPRTAWADLVQRLLSELLIADGLRWMFRTEALVRLMAHPRAGPAVVAACGSLAADPANQVVIEPLTILGLTPDTDASRHVMAQLARPTNDRALRGALLASVDKVNRRHFRAAQLSQLARIAGELLATEPASDLSADARILAAALLHRLPTSRLEPVRRRLLAAGDPTTRSILSHGQTALPRASHQVVERVYATAAARLQRSQSVHDDPVLLRLVDELLFNPNQNQRLVAGHLIAATPYREPVGAALAAELAITHPARAVPLVTAIICAMPWIGRPSDRGMIERLATSTELPAPILEMAAWKIGHVPGRSDRRFWRTALETHIQSWHRSHDPASMTALRGLVYGLGINHDHDLLRELCANPRTPAPIRHATNWWLNLPTHLTTSVTE